MKERLSWEEAVLWLKHQADQDELVRACYYDDPLIGAAKRYYESDEWNEVSRFLPESPGRVLDLGAGRGISSYAFAMDGWETTALEPDDSEIVGTGAICSLALEAGLCIEIENKWGEELPFEDKSFDVVHGRQVLHHAKDLNKLCIEVARVLKDGGVFIATREHVISKKADLKIFRENHPLHKLYGGENAYMLREYKSSIQGAGIRLKKVLGPLESAINYAPLGGEEMKKNVAGKFRRFGLSGFFTSMLGRQLFWKLFAKAFSFINKTPGRLYSFVALKPEAGQRI